ncbi:Uncharacterised protein [uncultured archaeon]|nr:Uncharacterised protein [uncultured archaeon]
MKAQLSPGLKELIARIKENGKEIATGPRRPYDLVVPYVEYRVDKTSEFDRHFTIRASSFEEAVDVACERIETACWDAQLRGDIEGWEIYRGRVREVSPKTKTCANHIALPSYSN